VSVLERLPFPAALGILAAATAAGVVASVRFGSFLWVAVAVVGAAVFAVLYLREYSRLPGPPPRPPRPARVPRSNPPAAFFAEERAPPTDPAAEAAAAPDPRPVEVDRFDPEYDPVAEADELETHAPTAPPPPPDA
jgi:hypothetical protein